MLVQPIVAGRNDLQQAYRDLLLKSSNFHTLPINATVAEQAARMRATYGLRLPDAIQIALLSILVRAELTAPSGAPAKRAAFMERRGKEG